MTQQPLICLIHPMDPRGNKVGGIETHVRQVLRCAPSDVEVVLVGLDGRGDLTPGTPARVDAGGRAVTLLPVMHRAEDATHHSARVLARSLTLNFTLAALRHLPALRRLVAGRRASAEVERYELATLGRLMGVPLVQVIHNQELRTASMDSLIGRFWFLHRASEAVALRLADHVQCVNPGILERVRRAYPRLEGRSEVMSVAVDPEIFAPRPFDLADDVFRVVFAGRLDAFKDPPLMFRTMSALHASLGGRFEFHYVGATDPHRYREFAGIEGFTVRHGLQDAEGVARVLARCHLGVLTSFFEGLPCFLLETLSVGRPFLAVALPQYEPLIERGVSGAMVQRGADPEATAQALARTALDLWTDLRAGRFEPAEIHRRVAPYTVDRQLARLFDLHRALGERPPGPAPAIPGGGPLGAVER